MLDLNSYPGVIEFAQNTGYLILFFIMIFEGPVITVAAAFAASLGLFNLYITLALSLLGNIVGDLMYYIIGKISRKVVIDKYLEKFHLKKTKIEKIETLLKNHPGKALAIIKLVPPLPTPGLLLAGFINMDFKIFFIYTTIISFCFSLSATLLGFYTGKMFANFAKYSEYLWLAVLAVIAIIYGIVYILKRLRKTI